MIRSSTNKDTGHESEPWIEDWNAWDNEDKELIEAEVAQLVERYVGVHCQLIVSQLIRSQDW